jgi:hypothetical protein
MVAELTHPALSFGTLRERAPLRGGVVAKGLVIESGLELRLNQVLPEPG